MDWLEPLRKDTERIRQENIKIKEETERLRAENRILERIAKEQEQIKEEQKLKRIVKESLQENLIYNKKHIKQSMKIFLDTADIDQIRPAYETGLIDGVTTNPTLILKSGRQLKDVITEISELFPKLESISAEVVGDTADEMLEQAAEYTAIQNATIKVPCTVEGLKVCRALARLGHSVNVTLVFSVAQAILANKAGAKYLSPFVGRWMDNSVDGIELIQNIRKVYDNAFSYDHTFSVTQILAASIRDVCQVEQCAKYGADVVTIPPTVFWAMYKNVLTEKGLEQFDKDWKSVIGQ